MLPSIETNLPTLPIPFVTPAFRGAESESLSRAFEWFGDAAASLERSYAQLQDEVAKLRDELARKDDELDHERESARQAKALAEVSAVLAHEIRNPLAGMELFTDLLLECGGLEEEPHMWADQLQAGLRTLTATVNNILQMHAADSSSFAPILFGNVLDATVQFLSPIAEQAGIDVLFEDWSEDTRVEGDPHRLQQVFLNIAMNAFRAMPSGGTLRLMARCIWERRKKFVEVRAQDTGTGIAPQHLSNIFDPGFTTRPGSVGLGLAVCRKIVNQHRGTVRVESSTSEGTTFVLTFPAL
jgi:signal transduction histidine kinase